MTLLRTHRQLENEKRVYNLIWKAVERYYPGGVNSQNPSLMAKRIYDTCRSIYDEVEDDLERQYDVLFSKKDEEIDRLKADIRELKGLPPLPPIPTA